ncbi:hypothetical protein [Corynebacterium uterequi]|uniref:Uncharacterized protein n=1 Tax=Corynebacterium uterequi TaxID=1072256 RepID=A0A0G3HBS3_9CORY|nr:hypothetical protein [Corynebacterium uterequi]AKK10125.1 hypothetical protein CUTER_00480 [Corynebacterium uterequi]
MPRRLRPHALAAMIVVPAVLLTGCTIPSAPSAPATATVTQQVTTTVSVTATETATITSWAQPATVQAHPGDGGDLRIGTYTTRDGCEAAATLASQRLRTESPWRVGDCEGSEQAWFFTLHPTRPEPSPTPRVSSTTTATR